MKKGSEKKRFSDCKTVKQQVKMSNRALNVPNNPEMALRFITVPDILGQVHDVDYKRTVEVDGDVQSFNVFGRWLSKNLVTRSRTGSVQAFKRVLPICRKLFHNALRFLSIYRLSGHQQAMCSPYRLSYWIPLLKITPSGQPQFTSVLSMQNHLWCEVVHIGTQWITHLQISSWTPWHVCIRQIPMHSTKKPNHSCPRRKYEAKMHFHQLFCIPEQYRRSGLVQNNDAPYRQCHWLLCTERH